MSFAITAIFLIAFCLYLLFLYKQQQVSVSNTLAMLLLWSSGMIFGIAMACIGIAVDLTL